MAEGEMLFKRKQNQEKYMDDGQWEKIMEQEHHRKQTSNDQVQPCE